ncbi:MAG: hypothetical protein M3N57_09580 [Actinomycetota bacterium]|nr:hypothetical protein [Actinomycetota bacterium]
MIRALAALAASILLVGSATAISRTRAPEDPREEAATEADVESTPTAPFRSTPDLPHEPADAEALGGDALLAAGLRAASGPWADLGHPAWPAEERPVYVGSLRLDPGRRRVEADVVVAFRADRDLDRLVLRLLPASDTLADAGTSLEIVTRRDGSDVAGGVDPAGARLFVPLDPPLREGDATVLRAQLSYSVADRADIRDDGGPVGFGLLAWSPQVTVLGHWLPLLTVPGDDGPLIPIGDVGAFPAAVWSLRIHTGGAQIVTGAEEQDCPAAVRTIREEPCVWARGVALRDVAVVAYDRLESRSATVGPVRVRASGPAGMGGLDEALDISAASVRSFLERFGPLAWREVDVVAAPLSAGAAGMEFPGLVVIGEDLYDQMDVRSGAYIVAHEVAHQWWHALVGNGSVSAPVVDESLAQYCAYLFYADAYGQDVAAQLADRAFVRRYELARDAGLQDEPPAQPLGEFESAEAYGALVYARAPQGWLAAEEAAGRDELVGFLAGIVDRAGLGFITDRELLAQARDRAPAVAEALQRYWFDPAPVR